MNEQTNCETVHHAVFHPTHKEDNYTFYTGRNSYNLHFSNAITYENYGASLIA